MSWLLIRVRFGFRKFLMSQNSVWKHFKHNFQKRNFHAWPLQIFLPSPGRISFLGGLAVDVNMNLAVNYPRLGWIWMLTRSWCFPRTAASLFYCGTSHYYHSLAAPLSYAASFMQQLIACRIIPAPNLFNHVKVSPWWNQELMGNQWQLRPRPVEQVVRGSWKKRQMNNLPVNRNPGSGGFLKNIRKKTRYRLRGVED